MKNVLEFNLPEDEYDYNLTVNGPKFHHVLDDFHGWLRGQIKYNVTLTPEQSKIYETVYDKFYQFMDENEVKLFY